MDHLTVSSYCVLYFVKIFNCYVSRTKLKFCLRNLTPCSRMSLEKQVVPQLVKKFPTFCRTWRFITIFERVHHFSVISQINPIHSSYPVSWKFIFLLLSYLCLGLPSVIFPSSFLTRTLYAPLLYPLPVTCRSWSSSLCSLLQSCFLSAQNPGSLQELWTLSSYGWIDRNFFCNLLKNTGIVA